MSKKKFLVPVAAAIALLNTDLVIEEFSGAGSANKKELLMESQGSTELLMFAGHRSHASHGSHGSHSSHRSVY